MDREYHETIGEHYFKLGSNEQRDIIRRKVI